MDATGKETNIFFIGLMVLILCLAFVSDTQEETLHIAYGKVGEETNVYTMLFTGDIMLAREVERMMERTEPEYPFLGIQDIVRRADVAVGNFEASVPEVHKETPDFGFQFSVASSVLPVLRDIGFDYLGLANNHTFDFGREGYEHTRRVCDEAALVCMGTPEIVTHTRVPVGDIAVSILTLNLVSGTLDESRLEEELSRMRSTSDLQVAYIHWGEEYMSQHHSGQETLAHMLIDQGVDAVIGHHPHVVQGIEIYEEKPIFYSLGNLVFDQYFDTAVQEGLMVQLAITADTLAYTLIPVTSVATPSQPQLMGLDARDAFLANLGTRATLVFRRSGLANRTIISSMEGHE
ncbi:CapA family protein [Candidatus Kaiserbacteria bacterium]|nr:CapA family protein [Candidatus Kaiserbacteria bacterium]